MSYQLNRTDGTLLVDLIDGIIDTNSTDLTLIGRNYTGFGESVNENFIKLLENFASTSAPSNPLDGQIWYDKSSGRLQVYNGSQFITAGAPFVQTDQPQMVAGDLWINNFTNQMYFYDGADLSLAGPIYTEQQGTSGFRIRSITDVQNRERTVAELYVGGQLVAYISNLQFTPSTAESLSITGDIYPGFNIVDTTNFKFRGTALSANALIKNDGSSVNADQFVPADRSATMIGNLVVQNNNGVTIGTAQELRIIVSGGDVVHAIDSASIDYKLRMNNEDVFVVDNANNRVGIWKSTPEYTFDVAGDTRIAGNLIVEGTTTSVDAVTLRIQDKNIELGITDDSTLLTPAQADGAGLTARMTGDDKSWSWSNSNDAWTSNVNVNVDSGYSYMINGVAILNATTLGSTVTSATGLTQIGTLTQLNVDNININGLRITSSANLELYPSGDVVINNNKITGVNNPTASSDATNKQYVDNLVGSQPLAFSMDITGLTNTQIALVLNDIFPSADKVEGTVALVHTTTLSGASVTGISFQDTTPGDPGYINKTYVAVDSNGVQNESVVEDFTISDAAGSVSVSITRGLKQFEVQSGSWTFTAELSSSV